MNDNVYQNSLKEVYDILQNTEEELVTKIPNSFMQFIKTNMNTNYQTPIEYDLPIEQQPILKETEAILALIFRSYWATEEEKLAFAKKDEQGFLSIEQRKREKFDPNDIYEIFEQRKKRKTPIAEQSLTVVKKENIFKHFFHKILNFFKR